MSTPVEDSVQLFDLDLLLDSAPTSTFDNIIEDVYVNQNFNQLESTEQVCVQNERNAEHLNIPRCLEEGIKDYEQMQRRLEEKSKDYDQLKQQFIKLGQDFADLHYESKKNALDAINANSKFEKITEELKISQHKMIAFENKCSVSNTLHKAALSNNNQLTKLIEQLESEAANLRKTSQSYKEAIKEEKRNNSTITLKLKTYEEDLCSIAGKLDRATVKKNRDRETQRQISKYTKNKLNSDLENDSESVDTGRGSSSCSSYSPAYSINFSPMNMIESFEQKMTKDASTNTETMNERFDLSKHLITSTSFEVGTEQLENKSVNVDSSNENIKTNNIEENITTVDTTISPISFVDDIKENITTIDTASSPISFVDVIEEKITTVDTASSPISFVDDSLQDMAKIELSAFSSFSSIKSPAARSKMKHLDCSPKAIDIVISPIYVANPKSPEPMAPSRKSTGKPIEFASLKSADMTIPAIKITDISRPLESTTVTSPVAQKTDIIRPCKPASVTSPVVQTPEITSPCKPATVTSSVVQTPEITSPCKPAAVTSPVVQTPEITRPCKPAAVTSSLVQTTAITRPQKQNAVTSPVVQTPHITRSFKPAAVTSPVVQTPQKTRSLKLNTVINPVVQTPEITRPFKPATMTSPVVRTPEITRPFKPNAVSNSVVQTPKLTRPLQSANVVERSTVNTPDMSMQLKPTAVTKHADLLTKPNGTNDVKRQSLTSQISEMAGHIESTGFVNHESKTTTSEHVISLVNNNISVITKTPDMTHPINAANVRKSVIQSPTRHMKNADARRPIINTKPPEETKQNENIKIFSSEKSLCKSFEEIQSHIAQNNNQERDDLEVRMILNSFRVDWNALSPMSITPTLDEEGLVQTKSDVKNHDTLRQSLEHPRSEISNESDSLLVIPPDYKKLTIPRNKSDMTIYMPQLDKTMHPNGVSNLVVQTPELTRPLQSANVVKRSTVKTSDMSMQLKPTAVTKHADLLTKTNDTNDVKRQSLTSQISDMAMLVQSKSDMRNHETLRQSSEHFRSEISNESDSLLVITPDYKKLTIPQNKSDKTMHLTKRKADGEIYDKITKIHEKIEMSQSLSELTSNSSSLESQSLLCIFRCSESNSQSHTSSKQLSESLESNKKDHLLKETQIDVIVSKPPDRRRSERIKSAITVTLSKTKIVPQTQLESSSLDNMSRLKESQSNISVLKELHFNTRKKPNRRSDRIKSTIPAAETNTPKQPERRRSERIKSIIPPVQSNTRKPRERRRSERINSTFPPAHSNTRKPLEKRRSERIKSTIPPAQSNRRKPAKRRMSERIKFAIAAELYKTNSEPQTQTKLHSGPIDNMISLKELQFNPQERGISDKINSKIPPAESKTDSVPQNQTKLQASLIDDMPMELGSNTCKSAETCMSDRIKSTIPPAESKTISVSQNQPKLQSRTINDTSMSKELESNTRKPAETCMSDRIKSTIPPAESKTNSVPQTQMELQSSPIDNMTSSKVLQCNTRKQRERRISDVIKSTFPPAETKTYSVPQTQTKLRSTPIDNMTSLKDLQSNMRKPAETCISDRIKSTIPPAESKTNSVPQNQTTLQASPIDIMSILKETETNTRSGYPPIVSNPENGRKRTICRSMEAQSDNKHSKHQNKSECDTNKLNPAEIFSEDKFTYSHSKEPKKRISRVKASVSLDDMPMELESCMSDRVKSTIPPAESKTNNVPQTQMKLQSSPIDNMTSSKVLQCNTRKQRERLISDRIESTIPTAESKTDSVPQIRSKLQSSPIDNITSSKDLQSNTRKPRQGRLSDRINSTMPPAESKTNRVSQTQTNLQASPIDIMSILRETETNTRSCYPPIVSNPENGRKRTICRSMEAQSNNKHSKHQNKSECDTNKLILAEIYSEDKFTYSHLKEPKKRISRVKARVSIDEMSMELESNTHKPAKTCMSDRVKSTIPSAESKTNNVPQTQMKLQSSPIDNMTSSKDLQCNMRKQRERRISDRIKSTIPTAESKTDSVPQTQTKLQSSPIDNIPSSENIGDRKSTETIDKELSYTPAFKRAKLADDTTGFLVKPGQDMNKNDCTKMTITDAGTQAKNNNQEANPKTVSNAVTTYKDNYLMAVSEKEPTHKNEGRYCADYNDIDIFNTDNNNLKTHTNKMYESSPFVTAHNLLDKMIFKYGSNRKWTNRSSNIISKDKYADRIAQEIESAVATCVKVSGDPNKYHETLQKAVRQLQKHSDISKFTFGFFKYLKNSDRKAEFLPANKNRNYSLKPIPTKYVVSLMQIIDCVDKNGLDLWEPVLSTCRYMLFNLDKNSTASLDVVESVTHLFVNMCQFKGRRNAKLIFLFMLTAMYCANYRAIIIIKHCLELVPEILPHECQKEKILNNMQPLFRTFIFLLHFYNCNDQFQKVHSVRLTLKKRYSYNPTQENDTTILFMLKQSILKINDRHLDIVLLEYSILILAKRRGTKWCHTNIVQKILLPIIQGEIYASKDAFRFCVTIITKLLKPYNHEMSGHSVGVANMLMNIVEKPHHQDVKDDIICGLLCINIKSVSERVNTFLANWNPLSISPKLEEALKQYIQKKPVKHWMSVHKPLDVCS